MKGRNLAARAGLLSASLGLIAPSALAGGLTTPPGMAADGIDWSQLGPNNGNVLAPQMVETISGRDAIVTSMGTGFIRKDEGNGWDGNFFTGTKLLVTNNSGPDITLTFDFEVDWVGAQIQAAAPGPFTAEVTVNGTSTYSETGSSNDAADGSAIFIGWSGGPITSISFRLSAAADFPYEFAIGPVYLGPESEESVVPETSTWAMLLVGFAGLGFAGYRRARKSVAIG
jgi:hypothetical protein